MILHFHLNTWFSSSALLVSHRTYFSSESLSQTWSLTWKVPRPAEQQAPGRPTILMNSTDIPSLGRPLVGILHPPALRRPPLPFFLLLPVFTQALRYNPSPCMFVFAFSCSSDFRHPPPNFLVHLSFHFFPVHPEKSVTTS